MPNPTFARFLQVPGANRGYVQGHTQMVNDVLHFTVGRYGGDYAIGLRGYFNFYVPREMASVQFAEADALTWHAGSWNGDGPGIEFERLSYDEQLTEKQINDGGELIAWLHDEWAIPLDFYDGPRVPAWKGFINHGSLLGRGETQDHTDGVTRSEWDAMTKPAAASIPTGDLPMKLVPYGDTYLQFNVNPSGVLVQSTYDKNVVLVKDAQDVKVLGGNRPSSDVEVLVLADQRIVVGCEDTNGANRAINYRPGLGWFDAKGKAL